MSGNRGTNSAEPPPIPPDAPAAKRGGLSTTAIVLIVCGVLALPVVAGVVGAVAVMVPKIQETKRKTTCMTNLMQLSHAYLEDALENGAKARRWSGSAMWLSRRHRVGESRLLCAGDPSVRLPESDTDRAAWDAVDLANPARHLCSYAGRDFVEFPIDPEINDLQPIGACVHHRGGAVVAFDVGTVLFMTRKDLGISEDDEIRCGPESASPLLRKLVGGN